MFFADLKVLSNGYLKTIFTVSVIFTILLWSSNILHSILLISTDTSVLVSLSSGQITLTSTFSPTDLLLSFRNIYSASNRGQFFASTFSKVQSVINCVIASITSPSFSDSCAINNIFCSFIKKGLYLISSPVDGRVKV